MVGQTTLAEVPQPVPLLVRGVIGTRGAALSFEFTKLFAKCCSQIQVHHSQRVTMDEQKRITKSCFRAENCKFTRGSPPAGSIKMVK